MPDSRKSPSTRRARPSKPRLLAGENPQIAKAVGIDGPAAVEAYIAAIPGWKREVARRLDELISRVVPGVVKVIKWNSPLYGLDGTTWFVSFHCFTNYVKLAFHRGSLLKPPPPGSSKLKHVRYLDIRQSDWGVEFTEEQLADWLVQASRLPGERM